jgi:hypothetical protein
VLGDLGEIQHFGNGRRFLRTVPTKPAAYAHALLAAQPFAYQGTTIQDAYAGKLSLKLFGVLGAKCLDGSGERAFVFGQLANAFSGLPEFRKSPLFGLIFSHDFFLSVLFGIEIIVFSANPVGASRNRK